MDKLKTVVAVLGYYIPWYINLWLPAFSSNGKIHPVLNGHMNYARKMSKRLARFVIHQMMRYQKKLESKQTVLNRVVDIGTDLFAIASTCSYADHLARKGPDQANAVELADLFCCDARARIDAIFRDARGNHDRKKLAVSKKLLSQHYEWLENGILKQ